jgi:hypothetical protein
LLQQRYGPVKQKTKSTVISQKNLDIYYQQELADFWSFLNLFKRGLGWVASIQSEAIKDDPVISQKKFIIQSISTRSIS